MNCLECRTSIVGRADKKFCSDYCRNAHNNKRYRTDECIIREVNKKLKSNRRILLDLKDAGVFFISEFSLIERGYHLNYNTASFVDDSGALQFMVYDQALRYRGQGEYELISAPLGQ